MSDAKLPLAYRDSCAHLLIPLNRCRYEEYYLPWKCEVLTSYSIAYLPIMTHLPSTTQKSLAIDSVKRPLTDPTLPERETHVRKVPVRGIQATCRQDGRTQGRKGWCQIKLDHHGRGEKYGRREMETSRAKDQRVRGDVYIYRLAHTMLKATKSSKHYSNNCHSPRTGIPS